MSAVVIAQSRPAGPLPAWQRHAIESVRQWALAQGYAYRACGDSLFDPLPADLRRRYAGRSAMLADLGRLYWLDSLLEEGAAQVCWLDADSLVIAPEAFTLSRPEGALFGLEFWLQRDRRGRLQARRNVHNAFMAFRRGDPTLAFYRDCAERRLIEADAARVPPQLVGPKLLTALDNAVGLALEERAGALSPLVLAELAAGTDGPARRRLRARQPGLAVANLGASLVGRTVDGVRLDADLMARAVETLLARGRL